MLAVRLLAAAAGLVAVAAVVSSAVRTVILPRSAQSFITRAVFRGVRVPFAFLANERRDYQRRDATMALFAPIGLLTLAATWMLLATFGFMLLYWSLEPASLGDAFHLSGSSITTLGFAPAPALPQRALAFTEAGLGLGLVALLITYLPSMYTAFSARETMVALMEVRAGSPPSAVEFLIRHHTIGWLDNLPDTWLEWEVWFAQLEETHTSYAALNFFRSPQPDRSWITAAGTVLDAGSLAYSTLAPTVDPAPAAVMIRGGYLALRRIADFFGIPYDVDPAPTDPISITRAEYDQACEALEAAGIELRSDRDQAWRDFAGWRVNYDTVLLSLAAITMAPYAPWSADRSPPTHLEPRPRRWGASRRRVEA